MELYKFSKEVGKEIGAFGSNFVMSRISQGEGNFHIGCMYFDQNDFVGRHDAVTPQLFVVVEGEGWVSGANGEKLPIRAGEAALWHKGESHEAGSETNMIAIVIESENLNASIMGRL
ncbi:cupin domain-containing protein [Bacillus suaedaesalsae]|uniref:Cupin n=1 Tax=Bacillus suaedaesalsae TaxID=2810349 RepID=A0ABS2DI74_9BACI|nr:cupin [Bacillus suaedaesalsae]MBM6618189.1 cupin [Bacillus suaedaesalsae]